MSLKKREITTLVNTEQTLLEHIRGISSYLRVDRDLVRQYIPDTVGVRSTTCLKLLLVIYDLGEVTRGYLRYELSTNEMNINSAVAYMVKLELLSERNMGVYVPCFNKHKFNKGYSITPKGIRVLTEIFDKIKE